MPAGDRTLLATGSDDGAVRLWDPADGSQIGVLTQIQVPNGDADRVNAVCAVPTGNRTFLALAGASHQKTVRLWDPADGSQIRVLEGHIGWVNAVCAVPTGNRAFLATASRDQKVRLWDPADGSCVLTVTVHHEAVAVTSVAGSLAVALWAGVLVIRIEADVLA